MDKNRKAGGDHHEAVGLADREALIRAIPIFQSLLPTEVAALAGLMQEVSYAVADAIVHEGELVDAVYIIADGRAEVTKRADEAKQKGEILLATLNKGETIGLSETGFYSTTGVRMATVTATLPCRLLKLTLVELDHFMKEHPALSESIRKSTDWMLHMRFIKAAAPFAQFSNERIAWLASLVKEMNVDAGTVIFKEGDVADSCYLICQGMIEITRKKTNGEEERLATLEPFNLFGEAALVTSVARNATASAITECRLLLLDREALRELIGKEGQASEYLIALMQERCKPIRVDNIVYGQRVATDGQTLTTLKNPQRGNYFQLSEEGWFIWRELDGKKTLEEITIDFSKQFGLFNPEFVSRTIIELASQGFAYLDVSKEKFELQANLASQPGKLQEVTRINIEIKNSDKKFDWMYRNFAFGLYTLPAMIIFILLSISGLVGFFLKFSEAISQFKSVTNVTLTLVFVMFIGMAFRMISPLAQGFAVKRFKHEVHHFTFGFHWFLPVAYIDLSDMWLAPRWQRVIVNLSGIFAKFIVAGLLSIYAYYTDGSASSLFFWLCAFFIYLHIIRNLDPMLNMDAYQVLIGIVGVTELRQSAIMALTNFNENRSLGIKKWCLANPAESIFWGYWFIYSVMIIVFVIWLQNQLLLGLLLEHRSLRWIIPCIFIVLIVTNIWIEIRDKHSAIR